MPAFLIKPPVSAGGLDICSTRVCDGRFAPATSLVSLILGGERHLSEVKRPEDRVGAVGSIELMVAMAGLLRL